MHQPSAPEAEVWRAALLRWGPATHSNRCEKEGPAHTALKTNQDGNGKTEAREGAGLSLGHQHVPGSGIRGSKAWHWRSSTQ